MCPKCVDVLGIDMAFLIKKSIFENAAWLVVLLILMGQALLGDFSVLSNLAVVYIWVREYLKGSKKTKKTYSLYLCCILFLIAYSLVWGNSLPLAIRFGLILLFVLSSYSWRADSTFFLKSFIILNGVLVVGLIALELYLFGSSEAEYAFIRNEIVLANGVGDVFLYNDLYYKLELRGTPLIVFVYMLTYVIDIVPSKYKWHVRFLFLIGSILAGNFAYLMAIVIFHVLFYLATVDIRKKREFPKFLFGSLIIIVLISFFFAPLFFSTMEEKEDGNSTRTDQLEVLMDDMSQSGISMLMGTGLGHTIEVKSKQRDYRGNTYYEIQSAYVLNQLGLVNFTILIVMNIFLAFRYIKLKKLLIIYFVYVIYASTNPYMWDTTHIVVIVSLICCKSYIDSYGKFREKSYLCPRPIPAR